MEKKKTLVITSGIFIIVFCAVFCVVHFDLLTRPVFQKTTTIESPSLAKYEKDGNLYIIDSGSYRLLSITSSGNINYKIEIDKTVHNRHFIDCTVDDNGNLYVYCADTAFDAYLTVRDVIEKYDKNGNLVDEIFSISYTVDSKDQPHTFYQIGSMMCKDGILTFSRTMSDHVELYSYDTFRTELLSKSFTEDYSNNSNNFSIAALCLKDFDNFIYSTRRGDIYKAENGSSPSLLLSCDFNERVGGIIPWNVFYDDNNNVLFYDIASGEIYRITKTGSAQKVIPENFFNTLRENGELPGFSGTGSYGNKYAGVFGTAVWYYDGENFKIFDKLLLPVKVRFLIVASQVLFVLGCAVFLFELYFFYFYVFHRYISLLVKQSMVIVPIAVSSFVVLYSITFNTMTERLNKEVINEVNAFASLGVKLISGDDVKSITSIRDFGNDAHIRLLDSLNSIVGNNKDEWNKVYYAMIYKLVDNKMYYFVISNNEHSLFRPYGIIDENSHEYAVYGGKPFSNIDEYSTGLWAISNFPIYDSAGKVIGIFEVGRDMVSFQIANKIHNRKIAILAAFIGFIIVLALVAVTLFIIRQLGSVAKVFTAIGNGNYTERVKYRSLDELGTVGKGLNMTANELQKQFEYINMMNASTLRFVPVQFMEHLGVPDITKLKLGSSVRRDFTILFFDIRAFSINSELMSVGDNFNFINKVLGISGPIIREYNGFVDKYMGDAAMALFPKAIDAINAGTKIYQKIVLDKKTRIAIGSDVISIGVGLHTGSVMMGIIGENERLSSTVISKNVNMASRMESLTKQTGSGMLITSATYNSIEVSERSKNNFDSRFLGMVRVAGVNEVTGIFDILDALNENDRKKRLITKGVFESGVRNFHTKKYDIAYQRFLKVSQFDKNDICAAVYLQEAKRHIKDPSLQSIFVFDKK